MSLHKVNLKTVQNQQMIDITAQIQTVISREKIEEGIALIYCPHTTAAITINENADSDVRHDILMRLDEIYPWSHPGDRHGEGNSAAHLKASTIGVSQIVPISAGRLLLGAWQGIYFCEFDGPRSRAYFIKVQSEQTKNTMV